MVADDVQHDPEAVLVAHSAREVGEPQARRLEVFVHAVEVHAPVAVVTGLTAVGKERLADAEAAGECLVRVVDDRRDPNGREAHVADVIRVAEQALEVAAQVADVVHHPARRGQRPVERAVGAPLVAVIVAGIAVDETIRQDEIHGLRSERLRGPVVIRRGTAGCRAEKGGREAGRTRGRSHCESPSRSSTRNVAIPAAIMSTPPVTSA